TGATAPSRPPEQHVRQSRGTTAGIGGCTQPKRASPPMRTTSAAAILLEGVMSSSRPPDTPRLNGARDPCLPKLHHEPIDGCRWQPHAKLAAWGDGHASACPHDRDIA